MVSRKSEPCTYLSIYRTYIHTVPMYVPVQSDQYYLFVHIHTNTGTYIHTYLRLVQYGIYCSVLYVPSSSIFF